MQGVEASLRAFLKEEEANGRLGFEIYFQQTHHKGVKATPMVSLVFEKKEKLSMHFNYSLHYSWLIISKEDNTFEVAEEIKRKVNEWSKANKGKFFNEEKMVQHQWQQTLSEPQSLQTATYASVLAMVLRIHTNEKK